ncbi:MAG TPA: universal stress protein [Thermoanaerobaculia bacterium]|nr:universal stress protein [Thermoanaerobaculia bacterium]
MTDPDLGVSSSSLRTIVAATDFSETAAAALDWAAEVAKPHGARIELVHALTLPAPPTDLIPSGPGFEEEVERGARERLKVAAAELRQRGIAVAPRLQPGLPSQTILDVAEETAADLIVLGTRGLTGLRHLLLGSTSQRVIQRAHCPVLTVHPEDRGRHRPLATVLLPTDFSEDARRAARAAVSLLGSPGSNASQAAPGSPSIRLVLLHAFNLPIEYTAYGPIPTSLHYLRDTGAEAETRLAEEAERLRAEGFEVETVAREGDPAEVIAEEARRCQADLLALGTHGRSGLAHLLLGSTAERVVQHAPCPVLTLRRGEPAT